MTVVTTIDERTKGALTKWIWAAAVYNLLSGLPLVLPKLFEQNYRFMNSISHKLGLGGDQAVVPDEGINRLFVNFAALLLVFLALLLIYASRDLEHRLGIVFLNAAARIASILLFLYYILGESAPRILFLFVVADLIFTIVFLVYINRIRGLAPRTWLQ